MGEHPLHVVAVAALVTRDDGHVLLVRVAGRGSGLPGRPAARVRMPDAGRDGVLDRVYRLRPYEDVRAERV